MASLSLAHLTPAREELLHIMQAALGAVDPFHAVQRVLQRAGETLVVGDQPYELTEFDNVWVLGAGKAGAPMAQAVEAVLGERLAGGLVVVKYDHLAPLARIELRESAHPVPDAAGLAAGDALLALAARAGTRDLVICLLSGGGSALMEALPEPLTLEDLQATTAALLRSGATINELNAVRKHLSRVKGGQLARAVAPATLVTLVLSDVVGSPLDVIASGPTVPDESTWRDVSEIIARYDLSSSLPRTLLDRLRQGLSREIPDTPKEGDPLFQRSQVVIVGDNALAAEAAERAARERGYNSLILTTYLEGEAREVARVAVALGREVLAEGRPITSPALLILGGETTVTLRGSGRGGRNQELALAAALALEGQQGIVIGTLATDGTDGPTDATGAIVDGTTVTRAVARGVDPLSRLANNDAYPLLEATGDLLRSGPTNTNVNDLLFICVPLSPATGYNSENDL
jgi:glycerate 2-kinase